MENSSYNTVYIVGNGLDICCGIKSSYAQFMESLKDRISQLPLLIQYLYKTHKDKLWTDLECELGDIANKKIHNPPQNLEMFSLISDPDRFKKEFLELQSLLREYLRNVSSYSPDISNNIPLALSLINSNISGGLYILNFNYTFTIENYLEKYLKGYRVRYKINHIHGTLNDEIIIGVQDSRKLERNHTFLYKSRHINPNNVLELNNVLKSARTIVFFGYSLGESDYSYFEKLFKEQSKDNSREKKFVFYYYGEEGMDDLDYNLRYLTANRLIEFYGNNEVDRIDSKHSQSLPRMSY